jgi:hypothetical protein
MANEISTNIEIAATPETYSGLSSGRRTFAVIGRIQDTFVSINEAIKEQAEARQHAPG